MKTEKRARADLELASLMRQLREVTGSMKRSRQALRENSEKIATHCLH